MKRIFFLLLAAGMLHLPLWAQDAETASSIADRHAAEERYKRMSTDVESLFAANLALQKKVSALESELQRLREEQARAANNDTTSASLKKLADAINEVDRNRIADKQKILDAIAKMERTLTSAPPPRSTPKPPPSEPSPSADPEKGYPHTIQSGDTLSGIVASYNSAFKAKGMKTISVKDVMDANPKVNVNALRIGQKIFVPAPPE